MNKYTVRVVRRFWFDTDYVGCYAAMSAVGALTLAGADPYMQRVMNKHVVRVEAVVADDLDVVNVRTGGRLAACRNYPIRPKPLTKQIARMVRI